MKMNSCRVWMVYLMLVGSVSHVFGELPPLLTESIELQSTDIVAAQPGIEERGLNYGRLERKLAVLFPSSKVYLIPMSCKVIVRGQCPDEVEAATILKIIRAAVVEYEPFREQTPFVLEGSEPTILTLDELIRLKRDELAAACILNELRVGTAIMSNTREVPPVPSLDVTPVAAFPYSTRSLPTLLHHLLPAESRGRAFPASLSNRPCGFAGQPSHTRVPLAPVPASMIEPVPPASVLSDPFQFHLTRAEEQLRAAGLTYEANQLQAIHQSFSARHHATLLIAGKEAQLKALQHEIAQLKQSTVSEAVQVSLRVQLVEVAKSDETWKAIGPLFGDVRPATPQSPERIAGTFSGVLNGDEIHRLLAQLRRSEAVKIVSEPHVTVLNGRQCRFVSGGEFSVPSVVGVGGAQGVACRNFETSIETCPVVVGDQIRLFIKAESTRQDEAVQQAGTHPTSSRRIEISADLRSGQTLVLSGLKNYHPCAVVEPQGRGAFSQVGQLISELTRSDREEIELLVVITPEIIIPMESREIPPAPGDESTRPTSQAR